MVPVLCHSPDSLTLPLKANISNPSISGAFVAFHGAMGLRGYLFDLDLRVSTNTIPKQALLRFQQYCRILRGTGKHLKPSIYTF